jgi:hypothetical protein
VRVPQFIHIIPHAMHHKIDRQISAVNAYSRRSRGPAERRVALFCHMGRMLAQVARRCPWDRLSVSDRSALTVALPSLENALATARAAVSMEWSGQDRADPGDESP